jgi:hypothetical protein
MRVEQGNFLSNIKPVGKACMIIQSAITLTGDSAASDRPH